MLEDCGAGMLPSWRWMVWTTVGGRWWDIFFLYGDEGGSVWIYKDKKKKEKEKIVGVGTGKVLSLHPAIEGQNHIKRVCV